MLVNQGKRVVLKYFSIAKLLSLKADINVFQSNFTLITVFSKDHILSYSAELKHGIFFFYLTKNFFTAIPYFRFNEDRGLLAGVIFSKNDSLKL